MFGINLFKVAGIELPETQPGFEWHLVFTTESNRFESSHDTVQSAGEELLRLVKLHKDVTHVAIGSRVK